MTSHSPGAPDRRPPPDPVARPGVHAPAGDVAGIPPGIEAFLGRDPSALSELTSPWSRATRTVLVRSARGRLDADLVVQWSTDRAAIGRRLRVGRRLELAAPAVPVPPIVAADLRAPVPYLVTRFVAGTSGRDLLEDDGSAARLGAAAGALARDLRTVPTSGLRLPRRWADPDRLTTAARTWLQQAGDDLDDAAAPLLRARVERLEDELGTWAPVFAHGDLAPVNLVMREERVAAVLDLERARLAHPLYDAAWWSWIVHHHHPERAASATGAFLEAAGIGTDRATSRHLALLGALACLEVLAGLGRRDTAGRRAWARRVAGALERA
jgi:aminoglycoside phosphotransferase (APT) family kinase protein